LTFWVSDLLIPEKFMSPLYLARIVSEDTVREVVLQVATPLTNVTGAGHSGIGLPLLVKVTVPVGFTGPVTVEVTVAVKVTGSFTFDGFFEDVRAVTLAI